MTQRRQAILFDDGKPRTAKRSTGKIKGQPDGTNLLTVSQMATKMNVSTSAIYQYIRREGAGYAEGVHRVLGSRTIRIHARMFQAHAASRSVVSSSSAINDPEIKRLMAMMMETETLLRMASNRIRGEMRELVTSYEARAVVPAEVTDDNDGETGTGD